MAQPGFYQTLNMQGVDPTTYYAVSASATPETPAPPFLPGTQAFGNDGSQFIFVQASTSITLGDFVAINSGNTPSPYLANSLTTTTATSSLLTGIGAAGLVVKQSVTFIPAGAFFWAMTRGQLVPSATSGGQTVNSASSLPSTNAGTVQLFTSAVAGIVTSVTTSQSLAVALQGILCVNSLTISIAASIIPPMGNVTSTGFTQGPVFALNNPRFVNLWSSTVGVFSVVANQF